MGSQRLGNVLHTRNYRRHSGDLGVAAYYAHTLLGQYGPLKASDFLNGLQEPAAGERPEIAQYYYTLRAIVAAERMVQVAPHEPEPLKLVAELQNALNNPKAAIASLRRVLELDSRDEYVHQLLAVLLTEIAEAGGDAEEARQNAEDAMRFVQKECARRSNDVMLCLEMRLLLLKGETEHALARFVKICRMTEVEGDWGLFNAIENLMNRHQYTEGRRIVNEALSFFDNEKGPVSALPCNPHPCNPHLGALDVYLRFLEGEFALPRYAKRVPQESVFFKELLNTGTS